MDSESHLIGALSEFNLDAGFHSDSVPHDRWSQACLPAHALIQESMSLYINGQNVVFADGFTV